jgi:hypothetical protein
MSLNGSGVYTLPSGNPVVSGTTISSTVQNNTMTDIANTLSNAMYKDGQSTPTANLKMGNFKLTGLAAGTNAGDSVRYDEFNTLNSSVSALQSTGTIGFKNRIINGAMVIDQRNAGASVTPTNGQYLVDRFAYYSSQTGKFTAQQNAGSVTPPAGFVNYLGFTSTSAFSLGAGDYFAGVQVIEGLNVADLGWGTANAQPVTLSFRVYSSLTGTFGGSLSNNGSTRSYPFTYTISTANTWTTISVTVAGDTSGTWLKTNGTGVTVLFGLGVGTTYSGTAGSWAGANYVSATGATSVVGTNGATFYITGVQLEKGSTATSFDYRPYGTELALCYRYYRRYTGSGGSMLGVGSWFNSTTVYRWGFQLDIPMRIAPTVGLNTCAGWGGNAVGGQATVSTSYCTTTTIDVDLALASAMGTGPAQSVVKVYLTGASPYVELNGAEL